MQFRRLALASVIPLAAITGMPAAADIVASSLPYQGTPDWTDIVFSGTSMTLSPGGGSSVLSTAMDRGVWFGWGAVYPDPAPAWTPGNATAGNYLQLGARFSPGAADWSAYFYDRTYEAAILFAPTGCADNCYGRPTAAGVNIYHADAANPAQGTFTFVPLDLTQTHVYEVLLKGGNVTYHVDGELIFTGAAILAPLSNPLVVIGDGSGSTRTGLGTMTVTRALWDNAPDFDTLPEQTFSNPGTITNPFGSTVTVDGTFRNLFGGLFGNAGTVNITGTGRLLNAGTFNGLLGGATNVSGLLSVLGGASFTNAGALNIRASGTLENRGSLTNLLGGVMGNAGLFSMLGGAAASNAGTFDNLAGGRVENRGTLTNLLGGVMGNAGTLSNLFGGSVQNHGTLTNELGGVMSNAGTLAAALGGASFTNRGRFDNLAGGTFENAGHATNALGGVMNNAGMLAAALGGASFANVGTLNNLLGGIASTRGTFTNSSSHTVNNEGTFTVEGVLENTATGTFNNLATGVLEIAAGGLLENDGVLANAGSITNAGTVEVSAGGSITGTGSYRQTGGVTRVDGALAASRIDIEHGALLGTGSIASTLGTVIGEDAVLSPGGDGEVGALDIGGDLLLRGDLRLDFARLMGLTSGGVAHDQLDVAGTLRLFETTDVLLDFTFLPSAGDEFTLANALDIDGLDLARWHVQGARGLQYAVAERDGALRLTFSAGHVAVPAPSDAIVGIGMLALVLVRRRAGR